MSLDLDTFIRLKTYLGNALAQEFQVCPPSGNPQQAAFQVLDALCARHKINLEEHLRQQLFQQIVAEQFGYGPLEEFLADESINEIMVNGAGNIFIERGGALVETDRRFDDDHHVLRVIDRMLHPIGRRVDSDHPMVDARLPDGSRVNVIIPPAAVDGPCITIRKFLQNRMEVADVIRTGTLTEHMAEFLQACVVARLNILISGPTSSGKTTLLNILSGFIPGSQRIVTIEDAVELQLKQRHVIRLETQAANTDGVGAVSTRDLVRNALRMRPDRIIVGEVRSG
jgi:pilus assembly protein CpaF